MYLAVLSPPREERFDLAVPAQDKRQGQGKARPVKAKQGQRRQEKGKGSEGKGSKDEGRKDKGKATYDDTRQHSGI